MKREKQIKGVFNNLHRIGVLIDRGDYRVIPSKFTGTEEETKDCIEWCRQWFNKQTLEYKLKNTRTSIAYNNDIVQLMEFDEALKEYWAAHKDKYEQYKTLGLNEIERPSFYVVLNRLG